MSIFDQNLNLKKTDVPMSQILHFD